LIFISAAKSRQISMLSCISRMFDSLENCARTPPPLRPLAPPQRYDRSTTSTSVTPALREVVRRRQPHDARRR
jgi:hypothetical protein